MLLANGTHLTQGQEAQVLTTAGCAPWTTQAGQKRPSRLPESVQLRWNPSVRAENLRSLELKKRNKGRHTISWGTATPP